MTKILVAVSGGVDSMVLLDLIVRQANYDVTIAHVDHGIRPESSEDARFVESQARRYGLAFVSTCLALGEDASEDMARQKRYDFLFSESQKNNATLATGHHRDDLIGSVAINCIRGTGWRGLAVMNRQGVIRPLLSTTKWQIYQHAVERRLEWVEDESNQTNKYLRNRLRADIMQLPIDSQIAIGNLRDRQIKLADEITNEIDTIQAFADGSRYFYSMVDDSVGHELLRHYIAKQSGRLLQPEQILRAIVAIKTAKAGTVHDVGEGVRLTFSTDRFIVDTHL